MNKTVFSSLIAVLAILLVAGTASAERFVMITHTQGTDPFWPVVQKGGEDAARAVGADFEYNFAPSGTWPTWRGSSRRRRPRSRTASSCPCRTRTRSAAPSGARSTPESGIPVITMNSGLESSAAVGALMHVGQPERLAGEKAGERARAEGATHAICLNQESFNTALVDRCAGYFDSMGKELNMIDVSNDVAQIKTRTAAALQADRDIDAVLAVGPHVCVAAADAVREVGAEVHLACFDLSPEVINLIEGGEVAFTIDQQQRLQGYMPIIVLHLYNQNAGLLPGANIPSGPGFVDASNAAGVAAQAGVNR